MKLWSRLGFLVLVCSSVSRGQSESAVTPEPGATTTPLPGLPDKKQDESARPTPTTPPNNDTSANSTDLLSPTSTTQEVETVQTTQEVNGTVMQTVAPGTTPGGGLDGDVTTVTMATDGTLLQPPVIIEDRPSSSWAYVILVLIILVIIALSVILCFLRRASRTYSFDLHRQVPANHLNEAVGTFEPVYLDDLDRPAPKDQVTTDDLSPPPISNGATTQSEDPASNGDTAPPQEQPDANGLETSPTGNASPSLGAGPAEKTSSLLGSTTLFFDALSEEQQNENNNNPSVCSTDPFVEINLDEPPWCDQLLTPPAAPSSVLPFSPFSFSSSSSSSP